jgi:phospholipid/cholesterol/gamma-HCH transport system substrate-binding protein
MRKQKTNTVRLGLFVIIAFILFTIGVYNIGNRQNLFGARFTVSALFSNVKGLQLGNNVRYAGINVGTVSDIILLTDSTIRVDMHLQRQVQEFLKKDAVASIGSDGLVGNMIVNISPGPGDTLLIEDGDIIASYTRIETEEVLQTLGNTTENVALLTVHLLEIAQNLNKGAGSLPMLIKDSLLARDLQMAVRQLRQTTQTVNRMSAQLESSIDHLSAGEGLLGYLLTDTTFETRIDHMTGQLDELLAGRIPPILDNLERSSREISTSSTALKNLIEEVDLNQGLVGAALYDTAAANNLKQTMENLDEGTAKFSENMEALRHHFLFRRYFKKQAREEAKY